MIPGAADLKPVLDIAVPAVTFLVMTIVGLDLTRG